MKRIPVAVTGDEWCNREQVLAAIDECEAGQDLVLEVNTEGPSLGAIGFLDAVIPALAQAGIDINNVYIDQWHNAVETVPFQRWREPGLSHFFWMSDSYRHQKPDSVPLSHVFGLFVGRLTTERAAILHDLYAHMPHVVLFSVMRDWSLPKNFCEQFLDWGSVTLASAVETWISNQPFVSITDHAVRDQYREGVNTNADLVRHYNRFAIELVCETYCKGPAFFPTEKTVRPISQRKPLLVYGPKMFLQNMRNLGFRTWQSIWDEDYDVLEGPARWRAIRSVMMKINDQGLWQHPDLHDIAQHNLTTLEQLINRHRPL